LVLATPSSLSFYRRAYLFLVASATYGEDLSE